MWLVSPGADKSVLSAEPVNSADSRQGALIKWLGYEEK